MQTHVLLVEDDVRLAQLIREFLACTSVSSIAATVQWHVYRPSSPIA